MTRADVILMIQFNALIRYRDSNWNERHGYVVGDSYTRWAGKNSYTITVKDPNAYSIDGCRIEEIVEVVDWRIPEECRADAVEIVRQQILNSYFNGDPSGEPEITYREETA